MFLKRIELQGFKSFASRTVLEFRGNITAIVGPNGSGKSNIADAIRWVLGEQSLKLLRGKKHHDVIFTGSKQKTRFGMAEVSLFFDNSDRRLDLDYQEVAITRRVYRDGNSEYLINRSQVRLFDVVMLLARAHFGQKSYAVVGQGMIDRIINLQPTERKEFFDEAAGVKQYQIKRDQAVNKLIRTEVNLEKVSGLLAEVEPRLRSLKRQVQKLARREKILDELRRVQIAYYGYLWQENSREKVHLEQQEHLLQPKKDALTAEIQNVNTELQKGAQEKSRNEAYQELQDLYDRAVSERNDCIKEQARLENQNNVQGAGSVNRQQLAWWQSRSRAVQNDLSRIENDIHTNQLQIHTIGSLLKQKIDDQQKVIVSFKDKEYEFLRLKEKSVRGSTLTVPYIRKKLEEIYQKQTAFFEVLFRTQSLEEFRQVKQDAKKITLQLADLMDELTEKDRNQNESLLKTLEQELSYCMSHRDNLVNEINEVKLQLSTHQEKLKLLREQHNQKQRERVNIETEIKRYESKVDVRNDVAQKELDEIQRRIQRLDRNISDVKLRIDDFNNQEQRKRESMMRKQEILRQKQESLTSLHDHLSELQVGIARLQTRREDLQEEISREVFENQDAIFHRQDFTRPVLEESREAIGRLKKQLEFIGGIDPEIVREHEETEKHFQFLSSQSEDLRHAIKDLEKVIDSLDETIKDHFDSSFRKINKNFDTFFRTLFGGGSAKLSLIQEQDVNGFGDAPHDPSHSVDILNVGYQKKRQKIISGVDIIVHPPAKKLYDISVLSGGEKALTAISLISAIIASNPPPFVVLDEVEASLDEANSERFTAILQDLSKRTQFIIITHNRATMKQADVLYGVTMGHDGVSRLLSVELSSLEKRVIGHKAMVAA